MRTKTNRIKRLVAIAGIIITKYKDEKLGREMLRLVVDMDNELYEFEKRIKKNATK